MNDFPYRLLFLFKIRCIKVVLFQEVVEVVPYYPAIFSAWLTLLLQTSIS